MSNDKDCGICLDNIKVGYKTVCNHEFCISCIFSWSNALDSSNVQTTCPMCKRDIERNSILLAHSASRIPKIPIELINSFLEIKGVNVKPYGIHVLLNDSNNDEWFNPSHLKNVIFLLKRQKRQKQAQHIELFDLKICNNKKFIFETPILNCKYYSDSYNKWDLAAPCFITYSEHNDLTLFSKLDDFFKNFIQEKEEADGEHETTYKSILKRCVNKSCEPFLYAKFRIPINNDRIPVLTAFQNSQNDSSLNIVTDLKDNESYKCKILFTCSFVKIEQDMYPRLDILFINCDKNAESVSKPSTYEFLEKI